MAKHRNRKALGVLAERDESRSLIALPRASSCRFAPAITSRCCGGIMNILALSQVAVRIFALVTVDDLMLDLAEVA